VTSWEDQLGGPARWTSREDQQIGPAWRTSRVDQQGGPAGRTSRKDQQFALTITISDEDHAQDPAVKTKGEDQQ